MNPFDRILIQPIFNLLIIFYTIFQSLNIPWALGFAIVFLTVTARLALWPLTSAQLKSAKKMASLKPHLDHLKVEHGHDKIRHQQEISKLYKEHGVNPLAGCLPLLLQIPVFIALYNVLLKIVQFNEVDFLSKINSNLYSPLLYLEEIPGTSFLGLSLAAKPSQWHEVGFLILLIPLITGLLQYVQSKMLMPQAPQNPTTSKDGKESIEDTMAQMQSQMGLIMPAMIALFSYGFPVGLSIYWNTFTIIGIIQQYLIAGPGALAKYLPKKFQEWPR